MTSHLRFLHVCERQFAGLPGEDPQQRRCDTCATVVHNLDAMPPAARVGLLAQARAEKTTVCVSLSIPPDSARACRTGAPVDAAPVVPTRELAPLVVPLAGVAMPSDPGPPLVVPLAGVAMPIDPGPPLLEPGDPHTVWRTLEADLPTVSAELAALAPAFALTHLDERRYQHRHLAMDLWVDVLVVPAHPHTRVGVRIVPREPAGTVARNLRLYAALAAMIGAPVWLILVLALWIAGLPGVTILLGPTAVLALLLFVASGFVGITAIGERAKQRAIDRWSAAWQDRFWPALTARIAEPHVYR